MKAILQCLPLFAAAVLAGCNSERTLQTEKDAADRYQRHRILIWAIDKPAHRIAGFDDNTIAPSQEVTLEPVQGYAVRVQTGPMAKVTITDFRREWKEDHIPFKFSHGTGSAEGTKDLVSPFLHFEYSGREGLASVAVGIPVGTIDSPPLLKLLQRKPKGTAAELEDLLFAIYFELPHNDYLGLYELLEVYQLLGQTERKDRWVRLLEKGTPHEKISAAAVLMRLGNEQATNVFCDAVLEAKGNRQVGLIEYLCDMPASDKALGTIVKLIIAPTPFLEKVPEGVGLAQEERRSCLVRSLAEKYPKEKVQKYAGELRGWAVSDFGKTHGGPQIVQFLANEQPEK